MTLKNCEINKDCIVKSININDAKVKLHLYEIGFFVSSKIKVLKKSFLKKTLLVAVLDSCFAIKSNMAEYIEVEYA